MRVIEYPDLWKKIKLRAVKDDTTISGWMEQALKKRLEQEEGNESNMKKGR